MSALAATCVNVIKPDRQLIKNETAETRGQAF